MFLALNASRSISSSPGTVAFQKLARSSVYSVCQAPPSYLYRLGLLFMFLEVPQATFDRKVLFLFAHFGVGEKLVIMGSSHQSLTLFQQGEQIDRFVVRQINFELSVFSTRINTRINPDLISLLRMPSKAGLFELVCCLKNRSLVENCMNFVISMMVKNLLSKPASGTMIDSHDS